LRFRRYLWLSLLIAVIFAAPRPAAAQSCLTFKDEVLPCRLAVAMPWRQLNFGAPRFMREPKDANVAFRSRWLDGHAGPWMRTPHALGQIIRAPQGAVHGMPPIDCTMARPDGVTLDPRIAPAPPAGRLAHSGVITPVAPCPRK
jgi:hypothetical protein